MGDANDFVWRDKKELPLGASPREKLKYIKDLAIFSRTMYGDMSHNDIQEMLDKIIEVSNAK